MPPLNTGPALRALSKLPLTGATIQLPQVADFPPDIHWGGCIPPKAGFERFFNSEIQSMLTLPTKWYGYEFDQNFGHGIKTKNVISGIEDAGVRGFFDTGVTFTLVSVNEDEMLAENVAEGLRHTTLAEMSEKLGGSTEWLPYGEGADILSLSYSTKVPEIKLPTGVIAPAKTMIYIQDLFFEKESGLIFRMKFESPEEDFDEAKDVFESVKTSGYFALNENGANGIAFLEL
jgi:hypothetical protein